MCLDASLQETSWASIWGGCKPSRFDESPDGLFHTMQGIMTHMTDVKPLIAVATYVDDDTGIEVYQTVTGAFSEIHHGISKNFGWVYRAL